MGSIDDWAFRQRWPAGTSRLALPGLPQGQRAGGEGVRSLCADQHHSQLGAQFDSEREGRGHDRPLKKTERAPGCWPVRRS